MNSKPNYHETLSESHITLDNLDAVFYLGAMFRVNNPAPVCDTAAHDHAFFEFHAVSRGSLRVSADNKSYLLHANEALLIPAGHYHATRTVDSDTLHVSFGFEIKPNHKTSFENLYQFMQSSFLSDSCIYIKNCPALASLTQEIRCHLLSGGQENHCRTHIMFSSFLFALTDHLKTEPEKAKRTPVQNPQESVDKLNSFLDYLLTNTLSSVTFSLAELSDLIYLDKKQINRIMKQRYQMTYKQKQIRFRIENAKKHLTETSLPIDKIASMAGYTNLTCFYKTFRKIVGVTPGEFRRNVKSPTQ